VERTTVNCYAQFTPPDTTRLDLTVELSRVDGSVNQLSDARGTATKLSAMTVFNALWWVFCMPRHATSYSERASLLSVRPVWEFSLRRRRRRRRRRRALNCTPLIACFTTRTREAMDIHTERHRDATRPRPVVLSLFLSRLSVVSVRMCVCMCRCVGDILVD